MDKAARTALFPLTAALARALCLNYRLPAHPRAD
jgi:hypothetical protein